MVPTAAPGCHAPCMSCRARTTMSSWSLLCMDHSHAPCAVRTMRSISSADTMVATRPVTRVTSASASLESRNDGRLEKTCGR